MAKKKAASTPVKKTAVKKVAVKKVVAKKATGKKAPASGKKKSPKPKLGKLLSKSPKSRKTVEYGVQFLFKRGDYNYYLRSNCTDENDKNIMVSTKKYNDVKCGGESDGGDRTDLVMRPMFRLRNDLNYEFGIS